MKAQIIVPLYISSPTLYGIIERYFDSLKSSYPNIELIVIDDASPLPLLPHWPVTYRNEVNKGYTGTVNQGLALSTADILIISNDDMVIKPGDLDRFLTMEGLMIASPNDTASDPTNRFGALWGMTRETFEKIGYLDERFKHFFSDTDYHDRATALKIPIIKWRDIVVEHCESATYNTTNNKQELAEDDCKAYWQKLRGEIPQEIKVTITSVI